MRKQCRRHLYVMNGFSASLSKVQQHQSPPVRTATEFRNLYMHLPHYIGIDTNIAPEPHDREGSGTGLRLASLRHAWSAGVARISQPAPHVLQLTSMSQPAPPPWGLPLQPGAVAGSATLRHCPPQQGTMAGSADMTLCNQLLRITHVEPCPLL